MKQTEMEYIEHIDEAPMKCMVVSIENSSPHWHQDYEVFFVLSGTVTVNNETGSFHLKSGDIILFNSCEIHSIVMAENNNLCLILQFSPNLISEYYKTTFQFALNTTLNLPLRKEHISEFQSYLAKIGLLLFEKTDGYQFIIKSHLFAFIGTMFRYLKYTVINPKRVAFPNDKLLEIDMITKYIKEHFRENLKVEDLCKALGMSKSKVYELLKTYNFETIKSLVNFFRTQFSKELLQNTNVSIQYIATESGFESDASFYRVFKEFTGVTPKQYRQKPSRFKSVGIQGYVTYSTSEAISKLKLYLPL